MRIALIIFPDFFSLLLGIKILENIKSIVVPTAPSTICTAPRYEKPREINKKPVITTETNKLTTEYNAVEQNTAPKADKTVKSAII